MVSNQYHSLRKVRLQSPIFRLSQLALNTGVSAHSNEGWAPPLLHCNNKQPEMLLAYRLPRIIPIFVVEVKGGTKVLAYVYAICTVSWCFTNKDQLST